MADPRSEAGVRVNGRLVVPWRELSFEAARAGGPGGQHVNKAATKVVLRFDVLGSESLGERRRALLRERLGRRLNARGEIVIHASRFRERPRNERDACERLAALLREGLQRPPKRRPTRPTRASKERRLEAKERRAQVKRARRPPREERE